ncbi:MAG: trypsin-like peptidase domain-containing protein [Vicinamibacterales bacterium]
MNRVFTAVAIALVAFVAFMGGLMVADSPGLPGPAVAPLTRSAAMAPAGAIHPEVFDAEAAAAAAKAGPPPGISRVVDFSNVVEAVNRAVVNIEATSRGRASERPARGPFRQDEGDQPRRGAGSGFIIDADGHILTNYHVVDGADRLRVKLQDGRTLFARIVGADPDTDLALIRVDAAQSLSVAPLGDSDRLRVGEWVCAIGNPLAYEHSVTVGVVSYIGRKLFDASLDNYIQTDAAINFGNSGGPLINSSGKVVGINAAISSRGSNIGFAVPINQATAILPQLKEFGEVRRGYLGVRLKEVDPDLERSLHLGSTEGALVEDVSEGSPAERAGLRTYDLIKSVDGQPVSSNDDLIRTVSARKPGSSVRVRLVRDGRVENVLVKLAERQGPPPAMAEEPADERAAIGLTVRLLTPRDIARLGLPGDVSGVIVTQVEALSPAYDAAIERGHVIMEINRRPMTSVADFERMTRAARPGDPLTFFIYQPGYKQRMLRTLRVEGTQRSR